MHRKKGKEENKNATKGNIPITMDVPNSNALGGIKGRVFGSAVIKKPKTYKPRNPVLMSPGWVTDG